MRIMAALVLLLAPWALAQSEALVVKIGCRGETLTVDPNWIESLILRGAGRRVAWVLETTGCPATARRVEIRFDQASPFGETPADKELVVPDLPEPLPASVVLIQREIALPGEHRYRVFLLDAAHTVIAQGTGRVSARVIAPAVGTWGFVAAGIALMALFWGLRRRLRQ